MQGFRWPSGTGRFGGTFGGVGGAGFLEVLGVVDEKDAVEIEILGKMRRARLLTEPLFDADGARMRG